MVTGLNFTPTTVVMWDDNSPLTTTYVSSTVLRAQVPTSLIGRTNTTTIVPSPIGTFNFGAIFTVTAAQLTGNPSFTVSKVAVQANDMVWSPTDSRLYLAITSKDASKPSTIAALDPQSGQFGTSVATGSNPSKLSISSDGAYLYASLNDVFRVQRYSLPTLQADIGIPLGVGANTNYVTGSLAVHPTNSHTLAVARIAADLNYPNRGDVVVFDDSIPRALTVSPVNNLQINDLLWNSIGQNLYASNFASVPLLYILSVDSAGVQINAQQGTNFSLTGNLHFDATTRYVYSDNGSVLDAGSAATIGNFPVHALQSGFNPTPLMIPDGKLNIAYFLGRTFDGSGQGNYVIEAFDLTAFNLLGTASIPNVSGTPYKFVRWGSNGLAFLTTDPGGTGLAGGVYLVSGDFITSPAR